MRNLRIFQNLHVRKIVRENVDFLSIFISEKVSIRIKIMRKTFTRNIFGKNMIKYEKVTKL
jgi:hypothetical protein